MEQLQLFEIGAGPMVRIEIEKEVRTELIMFMAEAVMAVHRAEKEVKDESGEPKDTP
jgi:hypothetical protein